MLEETAALHGGRLALRMRGRQVRYGELLASVRALAGGLRAAGVAPGDRVLLMLPNAPEFVAGYFAILWAGATVVPASPLLKPDEVAYLLGDAEPRIILSVNFCYPAVTGGRSQAGTCVRAFLADGEAGALASGDGRWADLAAAGPAAAPPPPTDPETVAACIYTSGTTGRPKGAMLTHRNLLANVASFNAVCPVDERDVFLSVLPLSHAFGATVMMLYPLSVGACVALEPRFVPDAVLRAMAEVRATVFSGVPAMYAVWADTPPLDVDLSAWRVAIAGGAALPPSVLERFEARYRVRISEGYGPTECAPVLTVNPPNGVRKVGTVGTALPGVRLRIVDEDWGDVPPGEVGEIAASGPNVMPGYWRRPEETRAVLRDGWFRTGDLGRMDGEGYVTIVDRKKDLVIVGGLNVYPSEVEMVIGSHPAVQDVAVLGLPDDTRGEVPHALVVLREGAAVGPRDLMRHCRERLAGYKVPRAVEVVPALPKTVTGKVAKALVRQELLARLGAGGG
jgi:long-chain acyl-CoA synthetase